MTFKLFACSLCTIVAAATSPAVAAWQEASSRHFLVYSDDKPDRVADYAAKLERFDKALRATRHTPDDPISPLARVVVFIVPSIDAVRRLYGKGGENVGGFYRPRASQTVAIVPRRNDDVDLNALVILLHEYSHHFMFSNYGRRVFPAWLVEGFAEFNSTAVFNSDGSVLFGSPANFRANGILDNADVPIDKLLTAAPDSLRDERDVSVFYARSWLLMHYLTMDAGRREQLTAYFTALNAGTPAGEAAKLLGDPGKLDKQLNAYVQRAQLSGYVVPAAALTIDRIAIRALGATIPWCRTSWPRRSSMRAMTQPRKPPPPVRSPPIRNRSMRCSTRAWLGNGQR